MVMNFNWFMKLSFANIIVAIINSSHYQKLQINWLIKFIKNLFIIIKNLLLQCFIIMRVYHHQYLISQFLFLFY